MKIVIVVLFFIQLLVGAKLPRWNKKNGVIDNHHVLLLKEHRSIEKEARSMIVPTVVLFLQLQPSSRPDQDIRAVAEKAAKKYRMGDGSNRSSLLVIVQPTNGRKPQNRWVVSIGGPIEKWFPQNLSQAGFSAFNQAIIDDLKTQTGPRSMKHYAVGKGAEASLKAMNHELMFQTWLFNHSWF